MSISPPPVMDQLFDYRARLLARLASQPAEVAAVLASIPEPQWYRSLSTGGRSIHQVMAHVRDVETLACLPRLRSILSEERPVLASYSSHDWSDDNYRPEEPLTDVLAGWSQTRAEALDILPPPSSPAWSSAGFHPLSGQRTLQWWAERLYRHAHDHLLEIGATGRG